MHVQTLVSFGGGTTSFPLIGTSIFTGPTTSRVPLPWATTMRNLVLISGDVTRTQACTLTLMKNGVATGLSVTLPAGETGPVIIPGVDVSFSIYDDCYLQYQTTSPSGGNTFAWCIEMESVGNVYGLPNSFSSFISGGSVGGAFGGGLGNGFQQSYIPPAGASTTYSICAVPCTATTLVAKAFNGAPVPGDSWTAYVRLNDVIQDGSGGTVDTRCTIAAGQTTGISTFTLPLVPGDHVDLAYIKNGGDEAAALAGHVGLGLGVIPDDDEWFMLTGGSNANLTQPGYVWAFSAQNETDEAVAEAPIGPGGFVARGLYLEGHPAGSDPDDQVTNVVRRSGSDTAVSVTRTQLEDSALIDGLAVPFAAGQTVSISQVGAGSNPDATLLYWGLAASYGSIAAARGVIGPHQWIKFPRTIPDVAS
jgi:hypothetical protein